MVIIYFVIMMVISCMGCDINWLIFLKKVFCWFFFIMSIKIINIIEKIIWNVKILKVFILLIKC